MINYPQYEVWGGDLSNQSYYDGGYDMHLEDCLTLSEAKASVQEWQKQGYVAYAVNKDDPDHNPIT